MCGRLTHEDIGPRGGYLHDPIARTEKAAMTSSDVRIGDAERERAVNDLGDHYAAGRLTKDELDDRLDRAWNARTGAELAPLFADLPGGAATGRAVAVRGVVSRDRSAEWRPSPGFGFPLPLLLILAVVLTVATHVPFFLFVVAWIVVARFAGGRRRRTYAVQR